MNQLRAARGLRAGHHRGRRERALHCPARPPTLDEESARTKGHRTTIDRSSSDKAIGRDSSRYSSTRKFPKTRLWFINQEICRMIAKSVYRHKVRPLSSTLAARVRNRISEPRLRATWSSFRCAPRSERDARGTSRVSAARARVTIGMADARATMERLASLAKAQVRFDPARRPEESGHPPIRRV